MPIQGYAPAPVRRSRVRAREETAREPAVYQETFDWSAPVSRPRPGVQEPVRYCNAPVAVPMHRAAAAILDYSIVLIAVGVVLALLHAASGVNLVNAKTLPWLAVVAAMFGAVYKLLWALAGTDSPGLRWTQLRTLNFDGMEPTPNERLARVAAACLSLLAAGLGLLWAMADEETLSWHDHMSKTFVTPHIDREDRD